MIESPPSNRRPVGYAGVVSAPDSMKPLVMCPLQFEMKPLLAALADRYDFICTGPGEARMMDAMRHAAAQHRPAIILAGLAGALTVDHRAGTAAIIAVVIDATSRERWTPTLTIAEGPAVALCSITSAGAVLVSAADRQHLHHQTGADLVDMESAAFARAATAAGARWAIVRGISDDPNTGIVPLASSMVDEGGRTRLGRAARVALANPGCVPAMLKLGRDSRRALGEVRILLGKVAF